MATRPRRIKHAVTGTKHITTTTMLASIATRTDLRLTLAVGGLCVAWFRKFAHNLKIAFQTPEEYFLQQEPARFTWQGVDPSTIPVEGDEGVEICDGGVDSIVAKEQELVVCVGMRIVQCVTTLHDSGTTSWWQRLNLA
jgi:hypothetical protein